MDQNLLWLFWHKDCIVVSFQFQVWDLGCIQDRESFCTSFLREETKIIWKITLESPPNLVFPALILLALSASLISN